MVTLGVMPSSTTLRTSTPTGVPRKSRMGSLKRLLRPAHTRSMSSVVATASAIVPPTKAATAGDPAAAQPPSPTSSSTAESPMSGAASSGPRPGWNRASPTGGESVTNQSSEPGRRTP